MFICRRAVQESRLVSVVTVGVDRIVLAEPVPTPEGFSPWLPKCPTRPLLPATKLVSTTVMFMPVSRGPMFISPQLEKEFTRIRLLPRAQAGSPAVVQFLF